MAVTKENIPSNLMTACAGAQSSAWASFGCTGLGLLLIVVGVTVSLLDRRARAKRSGPTAEEFGISEGLKAMAALAEALRDYDLGRFLVLVGFFLVLVGAVIGGFAAF